MRDSQEAACRHILPLTAFSLIMLIFLATGFSATAQKVRPKDWKLGIQVWPFISILLRKHWIKQIPAD